MRLDRFLEKPRAMASAGAVALVAGWGLWFIERLACVTDGVGLVLLLCGLAGALAGAFLLVAGGIGIVSGEPFPGGRRADGVLAAASLLLFGLAYLSAGAAARGVVSWELSKHGRDVTAVVTQQTVERVPGGRHSSPSTVWTVHYTYPTPGRRIHASADRSVFADLAPLLGGRRGARTGERLRVRYSSRFRCLHRVEARGQPPSR